jgi:hypothetical protein
MRVPTKIRRNQIRGELDSPEASPNGSGERLDRQSLGQPRNALDEQVSLGQNGDQDAFQEMILADDDLFHFVEDALHQ